MLPEEDKKLQPGQSVSNTTRTVTRTPVIAEIPETQESIALKNILRQEAQNINKQNQQLGANWNTLRDDLLKSRDLLYKADPNAGKNKQREADIKTLISAFSAINDSVTMGRGGTVPVRDTRADIYRNRDQADQLNRAEKAAEQTAMSKWMDKYYDLLKNPPKFLENKPLASLSNLERNRAKIAFDTNEVVEKDTRSGAKLATPKSSSGTPKEVIILSDDVPGQYGGRIVLNKDAWNAATWGQLRSIILNDPALQANKEDIQTKLNNIAAMTNDKDQSVALQSFLGQYVGRSQRLNDFLRRQDSRFGYQAPKGEQVYDVTNPLLNPFAQSNTEDKYNEVARKHNISQQELQYYKKLGYSPKDIEDAIKSTSGNQGFEMTF